MTMKRYFKNSQEREERDLSLRIQRMNIADSNMRQNAEYDHEGSIDEDEYSLSRYSTSDSIESPTDAYSSTESWSMAQDFLTSGSHPYRELEPIQEINYAHEGQHRLMRQRPVSNPINNFGESDIGSPEAPESSTSLERLLRKTPEPQHVEKQVRRFWITAKGLISRDESTTGVRANGTTSNQSDEGSQALSVSSTGHLGAGSDPLEHYRVLFLGSSGVGKRALIRLFADENEEESGSFDDEVERTASIILDGKESTMEFVDLSDKEVNINTSEEYADAYVVVYSVEDRRSYEASINRLLEIREAVGRHVALILVANKTDLVRCRVVSQEEGQAAAKTYDSKYIEVSAAIDLKIDELLVGVLQQIRLHKQKYERSGCHHALLDSLHLHRARHNALTKMLKGRHQASKSCDNLYVL